MTKRTFRQNDINFTLKTLLSKSVGSKFFCLSELCRCHCASLANASWILVMQNMKVKHVQLSKAQEHDNMHETDSFVILMETQLATSLGTFTVVNCNKLEDVSCSKGRFQE